MFDSQVDIFRKTVKWEELAPLPVGRDVHTAVLLGGNVYVGGGYQGRSLDDDEDSYRLDIYNLTTITSGAFLLSLHRTVILP